MPPQSRQLAPRLPRTEAEGDADDVSAGMSDSGSAPRNNTKGHPFGRSKIAFSIRLPSQC